jgi:hypothetical protein
MLEFSLRQPGFILLAAVVLLAAGLWSAVHLPIDAVPDITAPQVQVNTEVAALAAEESEKLVTRPIEIALAGLPGVEEMRSLTKFGLSQVTIQFKDGTDIYGIQPKYVQNSDIGQKTFCEFDSYQGYGESGIKPSGQKPRLPDRTCTRENTHFFHQNFPDHKL